MKRFIRNIALYLLPVLIVAVATTFDGFVIDEYIHKAKFDEKNATYIFGDDLKPLLDN